MNIIINDLILWGRLYLNAIHDIWLYYIEKNNITSPNGSFHPIWSQSMFFFREAIVLRSKPNPYVWIYIYIYMYIYIWLHVYTHICVSWFFTFAYTLCLYHNMHMFGQRIFSVIPTFKTGHPRFAQRKNASQKRCLELGSVAWWKASIRSGSWDFYTFHL